MPDAAYASATGLYETMAKQRPYLLLDDYEDICLHYPAVAEVLCNNLRFGLVENRIIDGLDDLFSGREELEEMTTELPEWAQPMTVEVHPEELDNIDDYPQSPEMSRDDSAGTGATSGPITPATHPAHVADNVPVVMLDDVDQVVGEMGQLKVSSGAAHLVVPSSSSSVFANTIGPRIARVFGSAGSTWFR